MLTRSGSTILSNLVPSSWRYYLSLCALAGIALWSVTRPVTLNPLSSPTPVSQTSDEVDQALSAAATRAIAGREGAIIVLDPQTGRLRAVVSPKIAFESAYAPGSTIKPFTALAALRAGVIDKNSKALCREHFDREGYSTVCSHPRFLPPFDPPAAIAYSCNYYFGRVGEKLDEKVLGETLASFGFGKSTSLTGAREQEGQLLRGKVDPKNALGEGDYLQTTPLQLIMAYTALVNGGHLFVPDEAQASQFALRERARLTIAPEHRDLIMGGMRGAVVYGTASHAGLNSTSTEVLGKTGTSTPLQGFRSQGWFVGFAADSSDPLPGPSQLKLAVLVFLKRGHGSDAAKVSRTVFEEFDRWNEQTPSASAAVSEVKSNASSFKTWASMVVPTVFSYALPLGLGPGRPSKKKFEFPTPVDLNVVAANQDAGRIVRIHLVTENITREVSLEDYVANVVATEGSMESEPEALKALAVVVRTYALKNLGRHVKDGYDFCSTTHCQRYQAVSDPNVVASQAQAEVNARAAEAVRATSGQVLRDQASNLADAYFGASCGGMTANIEKLWGTNGVPYLRGVQDSYCLNGPHHAWTDTIPVERLFEALHNDPRTDPGLALNQIIITRRDTTGRAELIEVQGERRHEVRGWDFKIVVGRTLGWNFLKSSRFEVGRIGQNFVFRGTGFGHGLGLCQEGAHVMAARKMNYASMLRKYFPGTQITNESREQVASLGSADLIWRGLKTPLPSSFAASSPGKRLTLSSEHFVVNYPQQVQQQEIAGVLKLLETTRSNILQRIKASGLSLDNFPATQILVSATTGDFVGRTGQPWWAAAATSNNSVEIQPIAVLKRRGVLDTTLKHELYHIAIDKLSRGRAPRWLAEGAALHFAGEGNLLPRSNATEKISIEELETRLSRKLSAEEMRKAYVLAYREVSALIKTRGEQGVWQMLAGK